MLSRRNTFLTLALSLSLFACGEDDDSKDNDGHGGNGAEMSALEVAIEEACEHSADGPFENVTATPAADGAPSITFEHSRVDVALDASGDAPGGYVTFESGEVAEYWFLLSENVPLEVAAADGTILMAEDTEMVDACSEIQVAHLFDLEVGTYTLKIGPGSASTMSLGFVIEEAGEHGEGHEHGDEHDDDHDDHGHE